MSGNKSGSSSTTHVSFIKVPQVLAQAGAEQTVEEEQGTKCASYLANSCHLGFALRPGGTQKGRRWAGRSVVNGSAHVSEISLGPPSILEGNALACKAGGGSVGQPRGWAGMSQCESLQVSSLARFPLTHLHHWCEAPCHCRGQPHQ